MIKNLFAFILPLMALVALTALPLYAEQHVAHRLGHPSTRFADPLQTPEDLRDRLTSQKLKADVAAIVNMCEGWRGNLSDFLHAAATAPITPLQIPIGTRLKAMSTRKDGKPALIRNLIWGGSEPIDAYEFSFYSKGGRYRCVTPKLCCNFWIEDAGPDLRTPILKLECSAPDAVSTYRPVKVCLTVKNVGDVTDELVTVTLPVPEGAIFVKPSGEIYAAARRVVWRISKLAPGVSKQLCADFKASQPGTLAFESAARSAVARQVDSWCSTRIAGIPAVLFEVVDIEDPIEVGQQDTYELSVTNQGLSTLTNVKVVCTLESSQQFVSCTGATTAQAQGRTITTAPLASLSSKDTAKWLVVVKALAPGDIRFTAELTSDQFKRPINETEATHQY